ncbi:hypothetical protein VP01_10060g1, partial [Puccinia sorghi]
HRWLCYICNTSVPKTAPVTVFRKEISSDILFLISRNTSLGKLKLPFNVEGPSATFGSNYHVLTQAWQPGCVEVGNKTPLGILSELEPAPPDVMKRFLHTN